MPRRPQLQRRFPTQLRRRPDNDACRIQDFTERTGAGEVSHRDRWLSRRQAEFSSFQSTTPSRPSVLPVKPLLIALQRKKRLCTVSHAPNGLW
jgi:hypothetical protein